MTDPHGNVVQLTDESGTVIRTYEYDSFGRMKMEILNSMVDLIKVLLQ